MFSQTVEYALRAMVYLAQQAPAYCTTDQIATATRVPKAYLSKVLQSLCRAGLVHSQRGVGGGVTLTRKPEALTVLEVINAVDPIRRIRECPLAIQSHGLKLCPLHQRLDDSLKTIETNFRETTLNDLLARPGTPTPLCPMPGR
jgi:Rrf2 family protein